MLTNSALDTLLLNRTWHICVGEDDLYVSPSRVTVQPVVDVVLETVGQPGHERRTRGDAVRIEVGFARFFRRQIGALKIDITIL